VFENYPLDAVRAADAGAAGVTIEEVGTSIDDTYPLAMGVFQEEELSVTCNYFGNRFSQGMVKRVLGQWMNVLRQLPQVERTNQITLLSAVEAEELLAAGKGAAVEYPQACVHELFAEQASKTPNAVAVVFEEQKLSYGELNEKAERLAGYLVEAGVKLESRVGICLGRSLEMMIGVLGVLKAGGAYVPLEPGLPKERVEYMVGDAGIEWVLMESATMGRLPLAGVDVIAMDGAATDADWLEGTGDASALKKQQEQVKSGHLAYILYTSGTTGKPKGVMVEHGGLTNYVGHAVASYVTEEIEGAVVSSPLSFDATLTTLLPALVVGRPVELLRDDERTLERLAERLFGFAGNREKGLLFKLTPAHLEALEYVERAATPCHASHRIVIGGEQLGAQKLKKWKEELLPQASFVNEYGPTETVVGCSVWELPGENAAQALQQLEGQVAAPIGKPIGNTELYVLGESGQLQPVNSIGELYIGGAGVARGYVKQEELTRERFVQNPFANAGEGRSPESAGASDRLYRTGDLVRWLADGELQFVGRRDQQVKIRGYRIELGEIESALQEQAGVKAAVVMAREDVAGQKRLVAYVVAEEPTGVDVAGLRRQLQLKLPEYMVPGALVVLDEMPLTGNGKVDRRALPVPEDEAGKGEASYVAPGNEIEERLSGIWQEVLKRERVGVEENFFSLGGDSILSIQMVSRARKAGLELTMKQLYGNQTIAELAAEIGRGEGSRGEQGQEQGQEQAEVEGEMELLPIQREFLAEGAGGRYEHNNQSVLLETPEGFSEEALRQVVEALYGRHDGLRMRFARGAGGEWKAWHAELTARMVEESWVVESLLPAEGKSGQEQREQREFGEWVEARCGYYQRSLDLEKGPVMRAVYLKGEAGKAGRLFVVVHHLVVDGVSWRVLLSDMEQGYGQWREVRISSGERS
jgi:amino acid adenylation domain-containing protein